MTDKMQVNLRQVAMEILYEVQKNNGLLHVVLSDALRNTSILIKMSVHLSQDLYREQKKEK